MDIPMMVARVRPGISFGWLGSMHEPDISNYAFLDWRDSAQTKPTEQELIDEWAVYQVELAIEAAEEASIDDVNLRWSQYAPLKGKTPAEIYTIMQNAMDSWTTLDDARTSLREWLPLMVATIAWITMRDVHTE